jgi:hypothetical protein
VFPSESVLPTVEALGESMHNPYVIGQSHPRALIDWLEPFHGSAYAPLTIPFLNRVSKL